MPPEYSDHGRWFAQELQPHESVLRAWLKNRFPSGLDIDDIVQEAYICTLRVKDQRDQESRELESPRAFLFGVARNLALKSMRSRRVRGDDAVVEINQLEVLDEREDVQEIVSRDQELNLLTSAIQALPDRCRQIFTLRKVYGMTPREISKELGISTRTVNSQMQIGLNKCAKFMAVYCKDGLR